MHMQVKPCHLFLARRHDAGKTPPPNGGMRTPASLALDRYSVAKSASCHVYFFRPLRGIVAVNTALSLKKLLPRTAMIRPLFQNKDNFPIADFHQRSSDVSDAYLSGQPEQLIDLTGLPNTDVDVAAEPTLRAGLEPKQDTSRTNMTTERLTGWRVGALLFALGAFISLIINTVLAIWVPTLESFRYGIGILWTGDCRTASQYNTYIHAGISIITTLLLSGSNYCMQCLTAPTRQNVQRAHSKGAWLDIGVLSIRNLSSIVGYKTILWLLLAISSIPLHLM
jgi:hypothetical protein